MASGAQPQEAQGEESRHLVEALARGHHVAMEGTVHGSVRFAGMASFERQRAADLDGSYLS